MINENILKNKNCFISGASGSIGECFAERFAQEGCNLFLTGTSEVKLKKLKNKIMTSEPGNIKIFYATGDFENEGEIHKVMGLAKDLMGDTDILINCIGITQFEPFIDTKTEDFDKMFNLNVRAPYILCREQSKAMIENKWGRIINIGSTTSYNSISIAPLYSASKHAILGLTRAMYADLSKYNIRVFFVSPGPVKSVMAKVVVSKFDENWDSFIDPVEIADYVAYAVKFDDNMISEEIRMNRLQERF